MNTNDTTTTNFTTLNISQKLVDALHALDITTPTPIQSMVIPCALEGKNILASAQTGTGKTIAYLIPLLTKLQEHSDKKALILTPTRELAIQVQDSARRLLGQHPLCGTALLIGGDSMPRQLRQLRKKPRLLIGTPGRINDLVERSALSLSNVAFFVLDEVDRMLDMGFSEQLDAIVKHIPDKRQTLMLSATMPRNIESLAKKYLENPERIIVGVENKPVAKIKQDVLYVTHNDKLELLTKELDQREGFIIVFVKTKYRAEQLAGTLKGNNHNVRAIHGGLRQQKRERVIRDFRDRKSRIMVATDIAARGLDVPHIQHVINYDLPQCPEDYLHRIGRTGRAGAEGSALSLISPDEKHKWTAINRLMNDNEFDTSGFSRTPNPKKNVERSARFGRGRNSERFGRKGDSQRFGRGGDSNRFGRGRESERFERGGDSERFGRGRDGERFERGGDSNRFGRGRENERFERGADSERFGRGRDGERFERGGDSNRFGRSRDSERQRSFRDNGNRYSKESVDNASGASTSFDRSDKKPRNRYQTGFKGTAKSGRKGGFVPRSRERTKPFISES